MAALGSQSLGSAVSSGISDPMLPVNRPTDDTATLVSSEVAEMLAQKFYSALSATRETIESFYVSPRVEGDKRVPQISFNGNTYNSGEEFQKMINEIEPLTFDIETLDCAPINSVYAAGSDPGQHAKKGRHMSVLVTIGGAVKVGDPSDDDERGFSDSYIMVPNPEYYAQKKKGKLAREWLIQTQNIRFVS